jgi:hypothetical protein
MTAIAVSSHEVSIPKIAIGKAYQEIYLILQISILSIELPS